MPQEPTAITVPSEILQGITAAAGSRVVLVVGAGVSMEPPTSFQSGADYSREAHRRLVADGVLKEGDCADPSDLSALAEAVYQKTNFSQRELTRRLPKDQWRTAAPNSGHLIAAALLLEGAIHHVISLNYDLAFQNAITQLGNSSNITFIEGPAEHANIGTHSVVYIHRSVNQDEETWVLRKSVLDSDWEAGWESVVAAANLAAPIVIFVGLGSPASVLTESVARLAARANSSYYLVDRNLESPFANALGPNLTGTVELYWCDFMKRLAQRVVNEQLQHLRTAQRQMVSDEPEIVFDDTRDVTGALGDVQLVDLGRARATWLLDNYSYSGEGDIARQRQVAHLLLCLDSTLRAMATDSVELDPQGRFALGSKEGAPLVLGLAHGRGMRSWPAISARIRERNERLPPQQRTGVVLVAGARSRGVAFYPDDLLRDSTSGDLVRGADTLYPIFVDDLLGLPTTELKKALDRIPR